MTNYEIAQHLRAQAGQLEMRDGNMYRVRAYRQAAAAIAHWPRPLSEILEARGRQGIEAIPGVGARLAYSIEGLLTTGAWRTLSGDDGRTPLDELLTTIPGVGTGLARRLREELQIGSLEDLNQAARDGKLRAVGVGDKRLRGIQDALTVRLTPSQPPTPISGEPAAADLLAVDEEFRRLHQDRLTLSNDHDGRPRLLPVLAVRRNGWLLRAQPADTALAHRMHTTHDWVVIQFRNEQCSGKRTVVTENRGSQRGQRVVRGRENECVPAAAGASIPNG
jgi:DNA polymerase (family X)